MTFAPPAVKTLLLRFDEGRLEITLNRPEARNAMSLIMVRELALLFATIEPRRDVRAVVLRGAAGHFSAGGDVKDMAAARAADPGTDGKDPIAVVNAHFGELVDRVNRAPQVVVAVLEGAVFGGGFGLACVADVALALTTASFGLPETGLGLPPAQIAPFLVQRLGISQARRLAVTGARFDGAEAARLGVVHEAHADSASLEAALARVLEQVMRCAPDAIATTKRILHASHRPTGEPQALIDEAARLFAEAARGAEGQEGTMAFIEKRLPAWAKIAKGS
ncbi:MAG TPA: enoyl-CoA hydratase-related protein [Polyangiaceae bacterium]|nr:enoyl-CoA hydratase-related protein [Polyangiaceae bacterium]